MHPDRPSARALVLAAILFVPGAARADEPSEEERAYCRLRRIVRAGPTAEDRERCRVIWEEDERRARRDESEGRSE